MRAPIAKKTSGTKASTFLALEKINQIPTHPRSLASLKRGQKSKCPSQNSFSGLLTLSFWGKNTTLHLVRGP